MSGTAVTAFIDKVREGRYEEITLGDMQTAALHYTTEDTLLVNAAATRLPRAEAVRGLIAYLEHTGVPPSVLLKWRTLEPNNTVIQRNIARRAGMISQAGWYAPDGPWHSDVAEFRSTLQLSLGSIEREDWPYRDFWSVSNELRAWFVWYGTIAYGLWRLEQAPQPDDDIVRSFGLLVPELFDEREYELLAHAWTRLASPVRDAIAAYIREHKPPQQTAAILAFLDEYNLTRYEASGLRRRLETGGWPRFATPGNDIHVGQAIADLIGEFASETLARRARQGVVERQNKRSIDESTPSDSKRLKQ